MLFLETSDPQFEKAFARVVRDRRESDADVSRDVAAMLNEVRERGDDALVEYTMRFDEHRLTGDADWRISASACEEAWNSLDSDLCDALQTAADRIRAFHEGQIPQDRDYTDDIGMRLGSRWSAVEAAGLYVPGGRAAYPSSLLMNAIPAKVAGVGRLVVTTPTPKGQTSALVLAAAHLCGIDEIWRVGGAQAVGALAYGTDRIASVDVIAGPGNAWVAEAKRQLYGVVGIDMVAGPSEILVIADKDNDPEWIAADLLSQAEHDPTSQSILITDDKPFARMVADTIDLQLMNLSTGKTAKHSWDHHGLIVVVGELGEAIPLADRLAAEHVELAVANPQQLFDKLRHAGSVFSAGTRPRPSAIILPGPTMCCLQAAAPALPAAFPCSIS